MSNITTYTPDDWTTTKGTSKIRNYDSDSDLTSAFWVFHSRFNLHISRLVDHSSSLQYEQAATADDIVLDLLGYNSSHWDIWGIDPLWQEEVDGETHIVNWLSFFGIPTTV